MSAGAVSIEREHAPRSPRLAILRRLLSTPGGVAGAMILATATALVVAAPLVAPYDPLELIPGALLAPPSTTHFLGTDELGRDVLSRILVGGRLSLAVSAVSVCTAAAIGIALGLFAGYYGGIRESLVMRVVDFLLAFPGIIVALIVVAILGPGIWNAAIGIAIFNVPIFARVIRARVLQERRRGYILAAECAGASGLRVQLRHLFPNVADAAIVQLNISLSVAVLLLAGVSFLGLGAQPPAPEWGAMLAEARPYLITAPVYGIAPGICLAIVVLGLNLLADALRDALDPRKRS